MSALEQMLAEISHERDALRAKNERLEARVAELEGQLKRYGGHEISCVFRYELRPCDCGLDEALETFDRGLRNPTGA